MEIVIIETKVIKHTITVGENWSKLAIGSAAHALNELESAVINIGFDSIHKDKSEVIQHDLEHQNKIFGVE